MKFHFAILFIITAFHAMGQNEQSKTDWANLEKYAAANKSLPPLSKNEKRIVFMGNSITEFWPYHDTTFFKTNGYVNRGISGQTTTQMLVRFRPDVIALHPDVVVILAGINDIAQNTGPITLEDIFGNIVSMVQLARFNTIKVVLCSVLPALDFNWRPGLEPADKIIRLNAMLKSYCDENHFVYVDYWSTMQDGHKGLDKKYSDDGVHPNLTGYKIMEPLVQEGIKAAMKQRN
jgi:lysophospholipase L1-like esterase